MENERGDNIYAIVTGKWYRTDGTEATIKNMDWAAVDGNKIYRYEDGFWYTTFQEPDHDYEIDSASLDSETGNPQILVPNDNSGNVWNSLDDLKGGNSGKWYYTYTNGDNYIYKTEPEDGDCAKVKNGSQEVCYVYLKSSNGWVKYAYNLTPP